MTTAAPAPSYTAELFAERVKAAADDRQHVLHQQAVAAQEAIEAHGKAEADSASAETALWSLMHAAGVLIKALERASTERRLAYDCQSQRLITEAHASEVPECVPDDLSDGDAKYSAIIEAQKRLATVNLPQAEKAQKLAAIDVFRYVERMYLKLGEYSEAQTAEQARDVVAAEGQEVTIEVTGGFSSECRRLAKAAAENVLSAETDFLKWLREARTGGKAV